MAIASVALLALASTFTAVLASDFPANPLQKEGWSNLIFSQEFDNDGGSIDVDVWLPQYLPHWTPYPERGAPRYTISDGSLHLRLDEDSLPWNPDYDGTVRVSSMQTYDRDWWHRFNGNMPNNHHVEPFEGFTYQYGYLELRAKLSNTGGGGHQALWLVGINDTSEASTNPEIDMLETFFAHPDTWRIAGYGSGGADFLPDWVLYQDPVPSGTPTSEYHVYAMEWDSESLKFYYDNQLYKTINSAPHQPMGLILSIYTDAGSGVHNDVWPKEWSVDYVRVWQK